MSKRHVRKMLRQMASGQPVQVTGGLATTTKLARLAFTAQQFGYEYADTRQGGSNGFVMLIVPNPNPQARADAAQNWARYPNASNGVSLPPLVPDAVELLKARINFDLSGQYSEKQRIVLSVLGITALAVGLGTPPGCGPPGSHR